MRFRRWARACLLFCMVMIVTEEGAMHVPVYNICWYSRVLDIAKGCHRAVLIKNTCGGQLPVVVLLFRVLVRSRTSGVDVTPWQAEPPQGSFMQDVASACSSCIHKVDSQHSHSQDQLRTSCGSHSVLP